MTFEEFEASLSAAEPPRSLSKPLQALWWLAKGEFRVGAEWDRAHLILQTQEGHAAFDWVHALAHWIEGDFGNSDYWYRLAGQKRSRANVRLEWEHMVRAMLKG